MPADQVFSNVSDFAQILRELRTQRGAQVISGRRGAKLTKAERGEVLGKTGGRCHICGGSSTPTIGKLTISWRTAQAVNTR